MKKKEFQDWLRAKGVSPKAIATRSSVLSRIEKVMHELASPHSDLDEAVSDDGFAQLRDALKQMIEDAAIGGQKFRILLPHSERPVPRLTNFRSWLMQYAAFRASEGHEQRSSDWPELEKLRRRFLSLRPDFVDFRQIEGEFYELEARYKTQIATEVQRLSASDQDDAEIGMRILKAMMPQFGAILRWQTMNAIDRADPALRDRFRRAIGRLAREAGQGVDAILHAVYEFQALATDVPALTNGEILNIALSVAGFAAPDVSAPFKIGKSRDLAQQLGHPPIGSGPITRDELTSWLALTQRIFMVMRDVWNWQPRDLIDVQGFAWVALDDRSAPTEDDEDEEMANAPLNTILYGPPGTGKTYATRIRAVAICDGTDAAEALDTDALFQRYEELREAGRIGFVTFHQSFSYEDFVEGLRPEVAETGAGFGLVARPGVLRQMAGLAATGRAATQPAISAALLGGHRVFKVALGRVGNPDHEELFAECIEEGYILQSWGGEVDWTDRAYQDWGAIMARWHQIEPEATGQYHHPSCIHSLRNDIKIGDIVIVPDGLRRFRAIGRVRGPYEFQKREDDRYHHRRRVEWLWHDGILPVSQILEGDFNQRTIYRIRPDQLKLDALAGYLAPPSPETEHPPHVLIIDEINRANISKVFGELITLLEEDKRAGRPNAITLRLPYSGDEFALPPNLHILGTMNTADRSIALLDTALRRRFDFIETPPRPDRLGTVDGIDLSVLLTRLNDRIEYLFDRDHLIGHAFFMVARNIEDIDRVMRRKVIPLLAEYFHEDWERIIAILGGPTQGFIERRALMPPPGLEGLEDARHSYRIRDSFAVDAYAGLQG